MNIFKLKFNIIRNERKRTQNNIIKKTLEKSVEGIVIEDPSTGVLNVKFNNNLYPIHKDSYKTCGKRRIYYKLNNEWIEYDRVCSEDRYDKPGWIPFKPKNYVVGNIVQEGENIYFKIRTCYNRDNLEAKQEAMRLIKNEDSIENNGKDSSNESTNK